MNAELKLLNPQEVCTALGISRSTLDRQVSVGNLPEPIRFGRTVRWRYADLIALVASGKPSSRKRTRPIAKS